MLVRVDLVGGPEVVEAAVGIVDACIGEGKHTRLVAEGAHDRGTGE